MATTIEGLGFGENGESREKRMGNGMETATYGGMYGYVRNHG